MRNSSSLDWLRFMHTPNDYRVSQDYITELGLKKSSAWLIPTHSIIYSNGATIGAISLEVSIIS